MMSRSLRREPRPKEHRSADAVQRCEETTREHVAPPRRMKCQDRFPTQQPNNIEVPRTFRHQSVSPGNGQQELAERTLASFASRNLLFRNAGNKATAPHWPGGERVRTPKAP